MLLYKIVEIISGSNMRVVVDTAVFLRNIRVVSQ